MKRIYAAVAIPLAAAACNAILGNDPGDLFVPPDAAIDASFEAAPTPDVALPPAPDAANDTAPVPAIDAGGCANGEKRCDGLCVSVDEPGYGCAQPGCDSCSLARATASCAGLKCTISACDPGFADCDQDPSNGCETDLSDPAHCGACNARCGAGAPLCAPQGPAFVCTTGCTAQAPTLCGTQCVDPQTSLNHCGGCNTVCPDVTNARATCTTGHCGFTCNAGYHACASGCANNVSPSTCGSSCTPCPVPLNGVATCTAGACGLSCNPGFANCDGLAGNGCETNTAIDRNNCGGCGRVCPDGSSCEASACTPVDSGPPPTDASSSG
jgi:hypothetical protein